MFRDDTVLAAIFVGAIGLLVAGIWALVIDATNWEAFKVAHECKIVGKMHGEMINTFDAKGNIGIGFTSGKTGWACGDLSSKAKADIVIKVHGSPNRARAFENGDLFA